MPITTSTAPKQTDSRKHVDQAGRPLGTRALQTRQRILDAVVDLLGEKPMRDLRVIDIARRIGSSPATFYQYFKDIEDVVLYLASEASERTPEIVDLIRGDWSGEQGYERGRKLANLVLDHWDHYAPILRVRNNASDEGDARFREVRERANLPMVAAFHEQIRAAQQCAGEDSGSSRSQQWQGGRIEAMAGATAIATVLERLSMYHTSIEELGTDRAGIVDTVATILQIVLTRPR